MWHLMEPLEDRRLLSGTFATIPLSSDPKLEEALTVAQVQTLLGQAASQAMPTQAIAVVDREGEVLGIFGGAGLNTLTSDVKGQIIGDAIARARTAAFFQSTGEAFTTRSARFIIQDHFPFPVSSTPGGPLYGVEFSSLPGSDILLPSQTPAISGDPGGIPLYIGGIPVGGIGVAGDFHDVAVRSDLRSTDPATYAFQADPKTKAYPDGVFFNGTEESDFDESVALAGATGFMAPPALRAKQVLINGLRLPFTANSPAHRKSALSFDQLIASGAGTLRGADGSPSSTIIAGTAEMQNAVVDGVDGLLRQQSKVSLTTGVPLTNPQSSDPIRDGVAVGGEQLTTSDVTTVIENAVFQAIHTRAGIRKPNGRNAVVHVAVTDTRGNVLGVFRMSDGTNFSYDVAVQKARTAAFFSDNTHAFSSRAIGFMSQLFFPPGIANAHGPLFHLQNTLSKSPSVAANTPLKNGITIFPGGFPLYKNGVLVGAVGVSGDGVDQDDIIAYAGTGGYRPPDGIRSDQLSSPDTGNFITSKVNTIDQAGGVSFDTSDILTELQRNHVRLPYAKFPRNSEIP